MPNLTSNPVSNPIAGPVIGLVGNPNCGKTTLFNVLTGANQRVGNWPGVTVERKEGRYRQLVQGTEQTVVVVDLPGVYSLDAEDAATGLDELVARDYLLAGEADVIVNIVDASNLERNLYLTTQILEMGVPLILAPNMMDVARKRDIKIDAIALSEKLGCPVVALSAASGQGVSQLKRCVQTQAAHPTVPAARVLYAPEIEAAIFALSPLLQVTDSPPLDPPLDPPPQIDPSPTRRDKSVNARWLAINLLSDETDSPIAQQGEAVARLVSAHWQSIEAALEEDLDLVIADYRYSYIRQLVDCVVQANREVTTHFSDRIDRIVLSRWWGIPIFLLVMYVMFTISINVGGAFIDFFDISFGSVFVGGVAHLLSQAQAPGWLIGILADGIGGGIQTTATFIPQIFLLFVLMSVLEDSGYMARAAFVMDRLMRFVGLPGKSFVPMLVGFGCNIPGVMATRTLENKRDRFMTIMMNPFMSCSARLTVYALFCAAFFPVGGQNKVMGLYLLGILAAIFTGLVLKHTLLPGEVAPFVMELPPYHVPNLKSVVLRGYERTTAFVTKAGKAIVLVVMILGFLNTVGTDGSFGKHNSQSSLLSTVGRAVTPAFTPMGITHENWPATVGLMTGVLAKEVMVGTLNSLYGELAQAQTAATTVPNPPYRFWENIGRAFASIPKKLTTDVPRLLLDPFGFGSANTQGLSSANIARSDAKAQSVAAAQGVSLSTYGQMAQRFGSPQSAFAYLLFVLLYFPCVSATGAIYRETNLGWTIFIGCWTTGLAYGVAVAYYQMATFGAHPFSSLLWIGGSAVVLAAVILGLKLAAPAARQNRSALKLP